MVKMSEKAKVYYAVIHYTDIHKVLKQIEVSAKEGRPDELCDLSQEEYNTLVSLMTKYATMIKNI